MDKNVIIDKNMASKLLQPFMHRIVDVFNLAWKDLLEYLKTNPTCTGRGKSNYIWERAIQHALEEFKTEPDHIFAIKPYSNNQTYNFIVGQKLLFRIKKGNSLRKSGNVPTGLSSTFHDPDQELPGIGNLPRIEIQYQLDKLESQIIDIVAVARNNAQVLWDFSLVHGETLAIPLEFSQPEVKIERTARKRIKPKLPAAIHEKRKVGE